MIKLKVPFKTWRLLTEKDVDFVFKIATLECATNEVLKCGLQDIGKQNPYDLNTAILYAGYIIACKDKYKRPKYKLEHAIFWMQHMSTESRTCFTGACLELLGEMKSVKGEKKK